MEKMDGSHTGEDFEFSVTEFTQGKRSLVLLILPVECLF